MRRFVIKVIFFVSILLFSSLLLYKYEYYRPYDDKQDYIASVIDKHRLLEASESPKIIFSGGSNVAFGIDSTTIEKELGITVVNMGFHAGLGRRFPLSEMEYFLDNGMISTGDTIVFSVEFDGLTTTDNKAPGMQNRTYKAVVEVYPQIEKIFDAEEEFTYLDSWVVDKVWDFKSFLTLYRVYVKHHVVGALSLSKTETQQKKLHMRSNFNDHGDFIGHLNRPSKPNKVKSQFSRKNAGKEVPRYKNLIQVYNHIHRKAQDRNIRLYILHPPWYPLQDDSNFEFVQLVDKMFRQDCTIPLLNTPDDVRYDLEYFFDHSYHLNAEGRDFRTRRVIDQLKGVMNEPESGLYRKTVTPEPVE